MEADDGEDGMIGSLVGEERLRAGGNRLQILESPARLNKS